MPVVAETTPATVRVVPAAGVKAPPESRSRAMPRLAERARSTAVRREPLAVSVRAAGVAAASSAPRADSEAMTRPPLATAIVPAKVESLARVVVPAPRKATLPAPASGVARVRALPPLTKLLAPATVKALSVTKAAPPRLRANAPELRAMAPPGSAPAASRRSVPPLTWTPAVEAFVPARARVPLATMVAPA